MDILDDYKLREELHKLIGIIHINFNHHIYGQLTLLHDIYWRGGRVSPQYLDLASLCLLMVYDRTAETAQLFKPSMRVLRLSWR